LVDKPQFARAPENNTTSSEIAYPSAVPTSASVRKDQRNKEQINDPVRTPIVDQESLAALRKLFELLDGWDRKEERP